MPCTAVPGRISQAWVLAEMSQPWTSTLGCQTLACHWNFGLSHFTLLISTHIYICCHLPY